MYALFSLATTLSLYLVKHLNFLRLLYMKKKNQNLNGQPEPDAFWQ